MPVDFGFIDQFNPVTGNGKVIPCIPNANLMSDPIKFSVSNVWDGNVKQKLLSGKGIRERVWYIHVTSNSVEQAYGLWGQVESIPISRVSEFVNKLNIKLGIAGKIAPIQFAYVTDPATKQLLINDLKNLELAIIKKVKQINTVNVVKPTITSEPNYRPLVKQSRSPKIENADIKSRDSSKISGNYNNQKEMGSRTVLNPKANDIFKFCQEHSITNLIHFTCTDNLVGILERGLLSRKQLEEYSEGCKVRFNDTMRLDDNLSGICLSITFPNYKMFYKYRICSDLDWAVLTLDVSILWKLDCAFFSTNAASSRMRSIPLVNRKNYAALAEMYADTENLRTKIGICDPFPTDPQAEVIVFEPIPQRYINGVHFVTFEEKMHWQNRYPQFGQDFFHGEGQYFKARWDHTYWA